MYLAQPVKRRSPTNRRTLGSAIGQQSKDSNTLLWAASFMGYLHEVALKILGVGKEAVALGLRVEPGTCSAPSSSIKGCTRMCPRMPGEWVYLTARQQPCRVLLKGPSL